MKRIRFVMAAAAAFLAAPALNASAADLAYTKSPVVPVYNWTGLYVGGTPAVHGSEPATSTQTMIPALASRFLVLHWT